MATYAKVVVEDSTAHIAQTSAFTDALKSARTIGGVSFNGTANIDLPGVNATGTVDTSGTADTAKLLQTSRDFSITGDGTASAVGFTGGGNVALSLAIGDNKLEASNLKGFDGSALANGTSGQAVTSDGSGKFKWASFTNAQDYEITLSAGDGISGGGAFTTNQGMSETITFNLDSAVAGAGLSHSSGVLSVDASQAITAVTGNFAIAGDLTVSGATVTTTTETLEINDNKMILNADSSSAVDAGFIVECGSSVDAGTLYYDASANSWMVGTASNSAGHVFEGTGTTQAKIMTQVSNSSLDANDTSVPVGGFQEVSGVVYVRTA
jgi:hypothetical protein